MPGETYQTLKSKATQHAKQSGMSQSAAENYGSAMASQAAQVGGAVVPNPESSGGGFFPEFFGGDQNTWEDIGDDIKEAMSGSTAAPLEQIAARKKSAQEMKDKGGVYNPKTGEVEYPQKTKLPFDINKIMTGIGDFDFSFPTPLGFGIEALKGMDSTNKFFKNLHKKKSGELSDRDKITLINLIQRGGEGGGLQYLEKWAEDNDLSEEETLNLANKFTGEYSNIASSISDSGIIDYLTEGGRPEGFKDSLAAMFGQYDSGKIPGRVIGDKLDEYGDPLIEDVMVDRPNLQTVTDNLGTVGLEYLKATNPAAYWELRPAATSGQIEELASTALTGNKDFDNQIFAAREQAARDRQSQDQASGIMAASPALPGLPVTPPSTPDNGTEEEDDTPVILPPVEAQTTTPFDLEQFYAGLPTFNQSPYASQGLGSYNDILKQYYGIG